MLFTTFTVVYAQEKRSNAIKTAAVGETLSDKSLDATVIDKTVPGTKVSDKEQSNSYHQELKTKFIEGNAGFMSLVAIALVLGLAFCIERIIYLSLSEIDAKKFMIDISKKIESGDIDGAKDLSRNTKVQ